MTKYNTANVPQSLLTINPSWSIYENAGILHNVILQALLIDNNIDSLGAIAQNIYDKSDNDIYSNALQAEQKNILPSGSSNIILQGMNDSITTKDMNRFIQIWGELFNSYRNNPIYKNTSLIGVLSVAYYSAQYWNYINPYENNSINNIQRLGSQLYQDSLNGPDIIHPYGPPHAGPIEELPNWLNRILLWLWAHPIVATDISFFISGLSAGLLGGVVLGGAGSWAASAGGEKINPNYRILGNFSILS